MAMAVAVVVVVVVVVVAVAVAVAVAVGVAVTGTVAVAVMVAVRGRIFFALSGGLGCSGSGTTLRTHTPHPTVACPNATSALVHVFININSKLVLFASNGKLRNTA